MLQRREFMKVFSAAGLAQTLLPGALWAQAHDKPAITAEMIDAAAKIAGVAIPDEYKKMMLESLNDHAGGFEAIFQLHIPNSVEPSLLFVPDTSYAKFDTQKLPVRMSDAPAIAVSKNPDELAFATVRELAELVRTRKISSSSLTEMYLERLKRYDTKLKFTVTLTDERARNQAKEADREIAAGKYRGPLHGLPWGAKDLLAVKGYPSTWGAGGFEKQVIDEDATVVKRLDEAGAVLVAKLTLGALAMGDHWFGGITRNPWDPRQGSSGSSAGPASATAAGCVAFSVGSETLGSISSPSTRCGCTGLRPTFGFVPRTGAMALSWSMDKLGPICRSVEDCALVLHAIHGPDGSDRTCERARDFQLGCESRLAEIARRLPEKRFRAGKGGSAIAGKRKTRYARGTGKAREGSQTPGSFPQSRCLRSQIQRRGTRKTSRDGCESDSHGNAEVPLRRDGGDAGIGGGCCVR